MLDLFFIAVYALCLLLILLYCLTEVHLARQYARFKQNNPASAPALPPNLPPEQYPMVTVQLPVYNEMYVAERLIEAVAAFDYPKSRFEIHILDDSTDETTGIIARKTEDCLANGLAVQHIRRTNRTGYKAGALQEALPLAQGNLIAIFDADFIPPPDFLRNTVPYFENPHIGMVQTRWQFVNRQYSLLTRIQAFFIDAHFTVEQGGRHAAGYCINFNGTAGVWRKQAITDGGGWQYDTLTEDLDLSYRTQLAGWKFIYADTIASPSELPADMPSFKSQQYRWIKGGAETAAKNLPAVWRSTLPLPARLQATAHLLSGSVYMIILFFTLLSVPMLLASKRFAAYHYKGYGAVFLLSNLAILYVHYVSAKYTGSSGKNALKKVALLIFPFLVISLGLSWHNALAALRGWQGKKTPFIRTPKFNLSGRQGTWHNKQYAATSINTGILAEGFISVYFLLALVYGVEAGYWFMLPVHLPAFLGFFTVFLYSVLHTKAAQKG
ncbi:histidine kinase [Sphingobacteriales bacterium UPWRP_1]|nr:hypothetical protein B6N25_10935 [Sphingobacteriales bacterium TSM_CSS]PSJ75654.1 histidine kinase [Sphingobacteriales bacterium UPWRP_1]